ncbi:MAG TPA: DUF4124 domain-containing protein [Paucimonas sp.]|nr:DUF4124 domain-containing protein [Paucimonas sp.]
MRVLLMFLFVSFSIATTGAASGQNLTKCVDANGKVTYSDQECPGTSTSLLVSGISNGSATQTATDIFEKPIPRNMKILYACELGKKEACFEKETLDKRCSLQFKQGVKFFDCQAYGTDKKEITDLLRNCKKENQADACLKLSCIAGDERDCSRAKQEKEKREKNRMRHVEDVAKKGLPSGSGWYMSQDWRDVGNGMNAAIITCKENSSVVLKRNSSSLQRISTSMTGNEYFLTIEEAARKACKAI